MPIYDFRCGECHEMFEAICRDTHAEGVACPACGAGSPSRLISRFAVSRQLTPCGTPGSEARGSCGFNARNGGCQSCPV